jgi:hypothetical protein
MELLFKREQTAGKIGRVNFKLWGKVELDREEQSIVRRYRFDEAMLVEVPQPNLQRATMFVAIGVFLVTAIAVDFYWSMGTAFLVGFLAACGAGYWYMHEKRETIFVRDLLHGRHFTCDSVVELARKEAWLSVVVSFLRQVMESAKHWDGTEHITIEALPKDEARQVILRGI